MGTAVVRGDELQLRGEDGACLMCGEGHGEILASAYNLNKNYNHIFFYGDVVVCLQPASGELEPADGLSWVGRVTDLCADGRVQVKWGDGNTSKVICIVYITSEIHFFSMMPTRPR